MEYLIKTYTNEWETVLDNCAGSWTTWVACINTNRKLYNDRKRAEICRHSKQKTKSYNNIFILITNKMEIVYSKTPFTRWLDVIDRKFGKPDLRELIILFWYASAGKTEFSYFVARSNANTGNSVCYISLELPEYDMKLRIARKSAGISKINWQKSKL